MTKIRKKNIFKIQPQSREMTRQIFLIVSLPPFHLKQEQKIDIYTVAKPHVTFQSFFLEMLDCIHSLMASKFNPKLSMGFEAIAI